MRRRIRTGAAVAAACLFFVCFGACGKPAVLYDSEKERTEEKDREQDDGGEGEDPAGGGLAKEEEAQICVYVCGEVCAPGVYELPAGARIGDAVEAAGKMTAEADENWLNLAEHMTDGQKIWVPSVQEAEELSQAALEEQSGLVNLNSASKEELMTLTGIGESKAKDIISYREEHGSFASIEELMQIPGIKEGVFEKIKGQVTV